MHYQNIKTIYFVLITIGITHLTKALELQYHNETIARTKRQSECNRSQFKCGSGGCVSRLSLCDGQNNCADGSDEIFQTCRAISCPESRFTFRCDYGACIPRTLKCNGVADCVDGSDESECSVQDGCILPPHVQYGKFGVSGEGPYIENKLVPSSTIIYLSCDGDETRTAQKLFYCLKNEWRPPAKEAKCRKPGTCPPIETSLSEEVFCKVRGQPVSCNEPASNTTVSVRCQPFYTFNGYRPIYKCENGKWDQPFTPCHPDCGMKRVGVTTLLIGSNDTIKNEYPWVTAIYNSTDHQICGGTIISRSYILSAAHCFSNATGVAKNKSDYTIVAGKYYRDINIKESSAQIRKIKTLYIHEDYRGKLQKYRDDIALVELEEELTLAEEVQPICLDWENIFEDFDFMDGNQGVVTGWGNTLEVGVPSDVLKKLVVPYRSRNDCLQHLPADFGQEFYSSDKFCAGFRDQNANVCSGDSGGGLCFKSDGRKYFIRGIVSISVKSKIGCESNNYALYTRVSKYLPWLEAKTRRIL